MANEQQHSGNWTEAQLREFCDLNGIYIADEFSREDILAAIEADQYLLPENPEDAGVCGEE